MTGTWSTESGQWGIVSGMTVFFAKKSPVPFGPGNRLVIAGYHHKLDSARSFLEMSPPADMPPKLGGGCRQGYADEDGVRAVALVLVSGVGYEVLATDHRWMIRVAITVFGLAAALTC